MDLLSASEIAEMLEVSRQHVDRLSRDEGFPAPLGSTRAGRVWKREDVEAWARETGRLK